MGETPGPISPPLIEATVDDEEFGYETKFKKGIVCPKCRCCIRRLHWRYWICENQGCSFTYTPLQRPMSVANAIKQSRNGEGYESEYQPPKFVCHSSIRTAVEALGLYDVYEYILPGKGDEVAGFIRLFKSNSVINQQPDGPNDLFTQMQINDFGLKRNPARNANGKCHTLPTCGIVAEIARCQGSCYFSLGCQLGIYSVITLRNMLIINRVLHISMGWPRFPKALMKPQL